MEIKFNEEIERRLNKLGVREQFVAEYVKQFKSIDLALSAVDVLEAYDIGKFITYGICWEDTSQGYEFWMDINCRFKIC
jgi:hypothetical protein